MTPSQCHSDTYIDNYKLFFYLFPDRAGNCKPPEVFRQGLCYAIQYGNYSWHSARNICERKGGDLAKIDSQQLTDVIGNYLKIIFFFCMKVGYT